MRILGTQPGPPAARRGREHVLAGALRAAGSAPHRVTGQGGVARCDLALFTNHVLDTAGGATLTVFAPVEARLDRSYQSSYSFPTRIRSGRNDGAAGVRLAKFSPQRSCLDRASGVNPAR
ncbi:MAG: hypothetical protein QOJ93_3486 [Actinomycetota bacterium]|nr:hypothetical protein [Actinomycetota bacterium]